MLRQRSDEQEKFDEFTYKAVIAVTVLISAITNLNNIYNEKKTAPSTGLFLAIMGLCSDGITLHRALSRERDFTTGYRFNEWVLKPVAHVYSIYMNPIQWLVSQGFGYVGKRVTKYLYSDYDGYRKHTLIAGTNLLFFRLPGMYIGKYIGNLTQNWWDNTLAKGWQYVSNYFITKPNYHLAADVKETQSQASTVKEQQSQVVTVREQKQVPDYSKLDKLASEGAKFFQHTRDKHYNVENKECTPGQAKAYIDTGEKIEVNKEAIKIIETSPGGIKFPLKYTAKEWISKGDLPTKTIEIERQVVIVTQQPVQVVQSATQPAQTAQINTALPFWLTRYRQKSVAAPIPTPPPLPQLRQSHFLRQPGQPLQNAITNQIDDRQYRQEIIKRFEDLTETIPFYTSRSTRQSRSLRTINSVIKNIKKRDCSLNDGLIEIISAAKKMGQNHPILIDANKCKGFIKDREFKYPAAHTILRR